jgi:hypothetical protein
MTEPFCENVLRRLVTCLVGFFKFWFLIVHSVQRQVRMTSAIKNSLAPIDEPCQLRPPKMRMTSTIMTTLERWKEKELYR